MKAARNLKNMLKSPSYRIAYQDSDFLSHEALRPVRLQLELLKPDMIMDTHHIQSTVVVFGSARLIEEKDAKKRVALLAKKLAKDPTSQELKKQLAAANQLLQNAHYYEQAKRFAKLVSTTCQIDGICDFVIMTGGGPGIMEAANKGAFEADAKSIGLNIALPHEDIPNAFITPELCFQFQYFAIRKLHFLLRAKALVAFPGGFGTLDELFETLTLIQTKRMEPLPVLLFGESYWKNLINFDFMVSQGVIGEQDLELFSFVETAEDAWQQIVDYYKSHDQWPHHLNDNNGKYQLYGNSNKPAPSKRAK